MNASLNTPGYWKRLWILYCKEWFRIKRNPAALMAAGLIVLMAFLVSIENRANQIAKRQEQLPCGVVYTLDTELIQALKSSKHAKKVRFIKVSQEQLAQGIHYPAKLRCLAEIIEQTAPGGDRNQIAITYKAVDANNTQMAQFNRWVLTEVARLNPHIALSQKLLPIKEQSATPKTLGKIDLGSQEAKGMIGAMMIFSAQYFLCMALFISFTGHERERGILQAMALTTTSPGQMLFAKLLFHSSVSILVSVLIYKVILGASWSFILPLFVAVIPVMLFSSIGFMAVAAIIVSVNKNQTTASLVGFSYLMVMGVVFSLASKFKAFAIVKNWMFESHAIELYQHWLGGKHMPGALVLAHMIDLFLLSLLLWCLAYWLFKRKGWRIS
ncbi:ABC transporter permease [Methylophilus sp. TWE2]|uniref:ABC transporter permease n=1 Tax=Methylophilus sp. TWE2 TaxID=1662285 RepID=UPI000671356D|nr:ABC transporter permease [Methylophilus sp. TWE2]AKR42910.1 hypothetical protein ACJ67_05370 [Methylophilus sp. TWE2]